MNIPKNPQESNTKVDNRYEAILHTLSFALKLMVETDLREERKQIQTTAIAYANRLLEQIKQ